jgi:hypothetical protein
VTALDQLRRIADLPWAHHHVAVMPDVHLGRGATVGSVIAMTGAVSPVAVGVDRFVPAVGPVRPPVGRCLSVGVCWPVLVGQCPSARGTGSPLTASTFPEISGAFPWIEAYPQWPRSSVLPTNRTPSIGPPSNWASA